MVGHVIKIVGDQAYFKMYSGFCRKAMEIL